MNDIEIGCINKIEPQNRIHFDKAEIAENLNFTYSTC
jgi:hypothetical protein